jgi:hypothetical protein
MNPIELHYSEALLNRVIRSFWWRKTGPAYFAAIAIIGACFVYFVSRGDRSWWVGVMGVVLVLAVAMAFVIWSVHRGRTLLRFRRMGRPVAMLVMSDQRLRLESDVGSSELAWTLVTEAWDFPDYCLLFLSPAQFVTIPLADLDAAARDYLDARLRNANVKML